LTAFIALVQGSKTHKPTWVLRNHIGSLFLFFPFPLRIRAFYLIKFGRDSSSSSEQEANQRIGQLREEFDDMISIEVFSHASMNGF
jgi:hypothetical protein